jgi:hypothetical protein
VSTSTSPLGSAAGATFARWRRARRILLGAIAIVGLFTAWLVVSTIRVRFARDVVRLVFNDNSEALEQARLEAGLESDSLRKAMAELPATPPRDRPVIVVSIAEHRLWYKLADSVIFTAPVATGSGRQLVLQGTSQVIRFETPRGRFVVQRLDSAPAWIPPDWHYIEQANKRGLRMAKLERGVPITLKDGSQITVVGNDVVRRGKDGTVKPLTASDGREIVADGRVVVPPYGTNQRKYAGVLGAFRLYLGDGYGIHGTDVPSSIGHDVSHGCVRLRNEDITMLYHAVGIGTPVFIY